MKTKEILFLILVAPIFITACSKSSDTLEPISKPRVGTTWTYQRDAYGIDGTSFQTTTIHHRATSEISMGGETWMRITDDTLGLVYLLNTKTGGLYQYANNTSNLFCKDPAAVNDTYLSYNYGAEETFTVKELDLSLGASSGASFYNVTRYEGVKVGVVRDVIWYNNTAWIVRRETWEPSGIFGFLRRVRYILQGISY